MQRESNSTRLRGTGPLAVEGSEEVSCRAGEDKITLREPELSTKYADREDETQAALP